MRAFFRGVAVVLVVASMAAPAAAADRLVDKAKEAASLREQARQGGAAVIVELAAPDLAAAEASGTDAVRESAVASVVEAFAGRFFRSRSAAEGQRTVKKMRYVPLVAFVATPEELERLVTDNAVVHIHPDRRGDFHLGQSVPLIGMPDLWQANDGAGRGEGTVIAVVDSGVQSDHPLLRGRVVRQACFSTTQGNGVFRTTSYCPNGGPSQIGGGSGEPCTADDGCEHGTHVAGIAAGHNPKVRRPHEPGRGVAPRAEIVAVKVAAETTTGGLTVLDSDWMAAFEYLYAERDTFGGGKRLAAINMSIGHTLHTSPCKDHPARPIFRLLRNAGVAVVISTGNDGDPSSMEEPACIPEAISVGNTTKQDKVEEDSNVASFMQLFAPGTDIWSSVPGSGYAPLTGTSMAAPTVAGAFAALASLEPQASVEEILASLVATGKPIRDTRPRGTVVKPRIQVDKALRDLRLRGSNLVASPSGPILLWSRDGQTRTFALTLSTRSGSERWRLLSAPDWLVASRKTGIATESGERIRFRSRALGDAKKDRTGWLVFATGKGKPARIVRVTVRR